MSFDLVFLTGRVSGTLITRKNAFTGANQTFQQAAPLTAAEVRNLRQVLKQAGARPDKFGCYQVEFPDGGAAEVFAQELTSCCNVSLRGITPNLAQFLFDFLKAANWLVSPVTDEDFAITASPTLIKDLPQDFSPVVICQSPDELTKLLAQGLTVWQDYRDQVVGNRPKKASQKKPAQKLSKKKGVKKKTSKTTTKKPGKK